MVKINIIRLDLRIYAACISLFLSLLAYSHVNPINYDGILYLSVAKLYIQQGLHAAMGLYPWPFYSILIAWISQLTHLSLLHAAETINTIFCAVIVITFITLVKTLRSSYLIQIFATITILLYPQLNSYRDLIVRDFGYWAFSLIGLWQLILYGKRSDWRNGLGWVLATLIASLFRVEGVIILALMPFILLCLPEHSFRQRALNLAKIYCIPLLIAVFLISSYFLSNHHTPASLGRLNDVIAYIKSNSSLFSHSIASKLAAIRQYILGPQSASDAVLWFICGFIGILLWQIVSTLGLFYTFLTSYTLSKKIVYVASNTKVILSGFIVLNLIILADFYLQSYFLSDRYVMVLGLTLALFVPFALENFFIIWKRQKKFLTNPHWTFSLLILLLVISSLSGIIHFGHSKTYITQAGLWLKNNTTTNTSVFSNNKQILFYAERTPINWDPAFAYNYDDSNPLQTVRGSNNWKNADYLALRITHQVKNDEPQIINVIGKLPLETFHNRRGDEVLIFKLR